MANDFIFADLIMFLKNKDLYLTPTVYKNWQAYLEFIHTKRETEKYNR